MSNVSSFGLTEPCSKASDLPPDPTTVILPLDALFDVYIRPPLFYLHHIDTDCVALLGEARVGPVEFISAYFHSPDIVAIRAQWESATTLYLPVASTTPWLRTNASFDDPAVFFQSSRQGFQEGYRIALIREVHPPGACTLTYVVHPNSVTVVDFALNRSPIGLLAIPRIYEGPSACKAGRITDFHVNDTLTTAHATFENLATLDLDLTPIYAGAPPLVTQFEHLPSEGAAAL